MSLETDVLELQKLARQFADASAALDAAIAEAENYPPAERAFVQQVLREVREATGL